MTGRKTQEETANEIESIVHSSITGFVDLIDKIKQGINGLRSLAQ